MRILFTSILAALAATGPAAAASGPSFSCAGTLKSAERVICNDLALSRIDRNIDRQYTILMKASGFWNRRTHRSSQRAFIASRDGCGSDFQCIRLAYRGQGQELRSALRKFNILCDENNC